jgi:hypothetical protein
VSLDTVRAFLRENALKAERSAKTRRESAEMWRATTNAKDREAGAMASHLWDCKISRHSKANRARIVECDEAVALKYDAEARLYYETVALLADAEVRREREGKHD